MRNQGNGAAALSQVRQHAGGRAVGFVLGIARAVQGQCAGLVRRAQLKRQGALAKAIFERLHQGLGLKTFNDNQ